MLTTSTKYLQIYLTSIGKFIPHGNGASKTRMQTNKKMSTKKASKKQR